MGRRKKQTPVRYGKALAQWLGERLKESGVAVEEIVPEDFGWLDR
jgi:hypothetical protein